ncbi:MAG: sulfatase-like hydrolase/transferase [Acidobacteriota bacterium]|nr:sulfatase-like hydrolase/transferase [Acidobacteriota bacterium]
MRAIFVLAASLTTALANAPNILWISSEDNGPHLGVYGDSCADTPNLDALGARGMIYRTAWSTAPVCAPARTTIISGMYPPSTGSQHMRSSTRLPRPMKMFPQYLREAGYYTSNNSKEDYNLEKPGKVWDESSRQAHWRKRAPGQPFFSVFNLTVTHESQIRKRPHAAVHDPAAVRVPAYHPDTPETRQDWAQYHDKITEMDGLAGKVLEQLRKEGLEEDTIVFYWADHGSGLPRSKRWTYNSGLHVPLILYIPEKFRHLRPSGYTPGGETNRLVGFIDFAPTLLSLAGIRPPDHFQGHAFAGEYEASPQPYLYGFRGRMDERYDMVRSVRNHRYIYIRNFMPHRIYGQFVEYMFRTPTTAVWHRLYREGKLSPPRTRFWETKPAEELYDLAEDPDETKNLAGSPRHKAVLDRLRTARREWSLSIRDLGFLPENAIHTRSGSDAPHTMGADPKRYPLERIMGMAESATSMRNGVEDKLRAGFDVSDGAVRYWAALGALIRGREGVRPLAGPLRKALSDEAPAVRVAAAEALGRHGSDADATRALAVLVELADAEKHGLHVAMIALNALDYLDDRAAPALERILALPQELPGMDRRFRIYLPNLIAKIRSDLK